MRGDLVLLLGVLLTLPNDIDGTRPLVDLAGVVVESTSFSSSTVGKNLLSLPLLPVGVVVLLGKNELRLLYGDIGAFGVLLLLRLLGLEPG